jgi:ketosteroid isomerase-like protein
MTDQNELRQQIDRWVTAELGADADGLAALIDPDFRSVGPVGFVLTAEQWVGRYRGPDFRFQELAFEDIEIRSFGDCAIAIGKQVQSATYQGNPVVGEFRMTQVWVEREDAWRLVSLQLSPIMAQGLPQS